MASRELVDYVKERRGEGFSDDAIRTALLNAGYSRPTIEEAISDSRGVDADLPDSKQESSKSQPSAAETPSMAPGTVAGDQPPKRFFSELFRIYRKRFWVFIGIELLGGVVIGAVAILLGLVGAFSAMNHATPLFLVILIVFIAFYGYGACVILLALLNAILHSDEGMGVFASFRSMFAKAWSYLLTVAIGNLITNGAFVLAAAFVMISLFYFNGAQFLSLPLLFVIGLLPAIPTIYFLVAFSLVGPVLLMENRRMTDALIRSSQLVKDFWWYAFGCTAAVSAIFVVILVAEMYVIPIIIGSTNALLIFILNQLLGIITLFLSPLIPMSTAVLYRIFQSIRPDANENISKTKGAYRVFALIPLLMIIALVFLAFHFGVLALPGLPSAASPSAVESSTAPATMGTGSYDQWQTYQNSTYGVQFQYPAAFDILPATYEQSSTLMVIWMATTSSTVQPPQVETLTFIDEPQNPSQTLASDMALYRANSQDCASPLLIVTTTVQTENAIKVTCDTGLATSGFQNMTLYVFYHNGRHINLSITNDPSGGSTLDQIVASLSFLGGQNSHGQ